VNVLDANVLLSSVNADDPRHEEARGWLDSELTDGAPVAFSWLSLLAFVRLSTKAAVFPAPLGIDDALGRVRSWLAQPASLVLEPTDRHLDVLADLLGRTGAGGNLTNDAHLAALAIEHGGTVVTYDTDFRRFPGVRSRAPGEARDGVRG